MMEPNPMGLSRSFLLAPVLFFLGTLWAASLQAEDFQARIDWGQRHVLSAPVTGVVREIAVRPGDRVETGDVLITLDLRRLNADLRAVEAELDRLRLELGEADREVARAEELYDRTLVPIREVELARIQRAMAASRLARAQAELDRTRIDLDDSRVRAPGPSRVLSVGVTAGEAVSPALSPPTLVILGGIDPMRAEATVDATVAAGLRAGQSAWVRVREQTLAGTVRAIGWEPEDIGFGHGYSLSVEFSPPESLELRAGEPASILLQDPGSAS
jgi:membrane fusion protein, multidrug efflux system